MFNFTTPTEKPNGRADLPLIRSAGLVRKIKGACQSDGVRTEVIDLTPELARTLLDRNPDNRSVSKDRVLEYAADITAGRWQFNGEPIIVSETGELNDGQHRCHAVILADTPITTLLVMGVARAARFTTDQGIARTPGAFLGMNGIADGNNIAAAARSVICFEETGTIPTGGKAHRKISKQEILDYAYAHMKEFEAAQKACGMNGAGRVGPRAVLLALRVCLARKADGEQVDAFIKQLVKGDDLPATSSVYQARERLITEKYAGTLSRPKMFEIVVRAWNMRNAKRGRRRVVVRGEIPEIKG